METTPIPISNGSPPKPRVPFTSKVWYRLPQSKKAISSVGANLSESGIFVQTTDPPEVGSQIGLQFFVEGSDQPVEAIAQVIWVKPFEPINIDGLLPGMGAKFLTIGASSVDSIRCFVEDNIKKTPPPPPVHTNTILQSNEKKITSFPLENPMVLQLKGDHEPIFGYSTEIDQGSIRFCTDFVPKESVAHGLENKSVAKKVRGCIGIPVEIEQIARQQHGSADPRQLSMSLDFIELREEIIKIRPRLKTNADQATNLPAPVENQPKVRPRPTPKPTGINLGTVAAVGLALFICGLLIGLVL